MHAWCVCGTSTAAAGAFTNVKRLSVFVSSGAQLMRAKLKIHCTVSVCVERAQKEETKIESGGRTGSAKADSPPPLLLLFLSLSPSLSLSVSLSSVLGCPNEMWASCRTMKRGSQGCFFTVPEPQCASFNLMFQCKFFFHKLPSPHVCNMAGFTLQPLCHYGYQGTAKCIVAKATFYCLFILLRSLWLPSTWRMRRAPRQKIKVLSVSAAFASYCQVFFNGRRVAESVQW